MNISPDIMSDIFTFHENSNYKLRSSIHHGIRNMRTKLFETETALHLGTKIWFLLLGKLKSPSSLLVFKNKAKK